MAQKWLGEIFDQARQHYFLWAKLTYMIVYAAAEIKSD